MTLLLRCSTRNTVWSDGDVDAILAADFQDRERGGVDMKLSVFDAPREDALRVLMEFCASMDLGIRAKAYVFDIKGISDAPVVENEGDTQFRYTRERHREVHFQDSGGVRLLVETLVTDRTRWLEFPRADMRAFLKARLDEGDEEWLAFRAANSKWKP